MIVESYSQVITDILGWWLANPKRRYELTQEQDSTIKGLLPESPAASGVTPNNDFNVRY